MHTLKRIGRVLAVLMAVLVILLSIAGIFGAWWLNRTVTDVTLRTFAVLETGVSIAETGLNRVETLVQTGRTEVQQAADTITAVGANLQENSPVLTALSNRLQTRLAPTVENIRQAIAPVQEALITINNIVDIAAAIPGLSQRAPRLARLDATFDQLEQTAADVKQLDDTLRASVVEGKNQLTQEAVNTLTGITARVDTRLAEAESAVNEAEGEIDAFQVDMATTKSRLLLFYDLSAVALTLLMFWLIYSQVVVIRHHWRGLRDKPGAAAGVALEPAAESPAEPAATVEPEQPDA